MRELVSFDDWVIDSDTPFGSGASKKHWLVNYSSNQRGIFKYPKTTSNNSVTGEYWAECLAYDIANSLRVSCAKVDIGTFNGAIGSMSYMILEKDEVLEEGISYIAKEYPSYNTDRFVDTSSGVWYSLQMILHSLKDTNLKNDFFMVPIFDGLIGNTDRHHSNWGVVINEKTQLKKLSPLYDNGSSLCSIINESKINIADKNWFNALIDTRSRSRIRIDNVKVEPTHFQVLRFLAEHYHLECIYYVETIKSILTNNIIHDLINNYPDDIISPKVKELLFLFLSERRNRIINIFERK